MHKEAVKTKIIQDSKLVFGAGLSTLNRISIIKPKIHSRVIKAYDLVTPTRFTRNGSNLSKLEETNDWS